MRIYGIILITVLTACSPIINGAEVKETKAKQRHLYSGSPAQYDWADDYGTVVFLLKQHTYRGTKQAKGIVKRGNLQGWMTGDYGTLSDFIKNETAKGKNEYPKIIQDANWRYIYNVMTDESYAHAQHERRAKSAHPAEWGNIHQKIEDLMRRGRPDDILYAKRLAEREYRHKRKKHDRQPLGEIEGPRGSLLEIAEQLQNVSPELKSYKQWKDLLEVLRKK